MKRNQDGKVNIEKLKELERLVIPTLLLQPEVWKSLDVDYYPPRVERMFIDHGDGYRIYLHVIHKTSEECLYHKHRWPAALKQVWGSYRMGLTYSEQEVSSSEAHGLSDIARFEIHAGSYYEMTQTDALHYVSPITPTSGSIMLTREKFPEHIFRKELLDRPLLELPLLRRLEILDQFGRNLNPPNQ